MGTAILIVLIFGTLITVATFYNTKYQKLPTPIPITPLKSPSCPNGGCVSYSLTNLLNDDYFKDNLPPNERGYSFSDADNAVREWSDGVMRVEVVLAKERVSINNFYGHPTLKQTVQACKQNQSPLKPNSQYSLLLLDIVTSKQQSHCIGVVWDILGGEFGECIVIDPARETTQPKPFRELFALYDVRSVGMVMMGVNAPAALTKKQLSHLYNGKEKSTTKTPSNNNQPPLKKVG